jgi:hypothetical protein
MQFLPNCTVLCFVRISCSLSVVKNHEVLEILLVHVVPHGQWPLLFPKRGVLKQIPLIIYGNDT